MKRICYHTQEKRKVILKQPLKCEKINAWLGIGYYFWIDENDALFWGQVAKRKTGKYDVYIAHIVFEDILDTVFNEEHYTFWLKNIEKAGKTILKKTGIKPTLKEINEYFMERGIWNEIDGIMFQDISQNETHYIVQQFQYKKRIQLGLFNLNKMSNFAHHFTGDCV